MYKILIIILFSSCAYITLNKKTNWYYQLQNVNYRYFKNIKDSILVLDAYNDNGIPLESSLIQKLKSKGNKVFSYLSIGEAESYRPYFKKLNKTLILDENKNWDGNFTVKFWETQWQETIEVYLNQIINQGFNGVYLDIIDVFHRFKDKKLYAQKMASFITKISNQAKYRNSNFLIILQNGIDIISYIEDSNKLLKDIDGIALEAYIFKYAEDNKKALSLSEEEEHFNYIKQYQDANKLILSVEYNLNPDQTELYFSLAKKYKFIPLVTDLELKGLFFKHAK